MIAKLLVCTFIGGPFMVFSSSYDSVLVKHRGKPSVIVPTVAYPDEHRIDFDDGERSYVITHGVLSIQEGKANATFLITCEKKSMEAITKKLMEEY